MHWRLERFNIYTKFPFLSVSFSLGMAFAIQNTVNAVESDVLWLPKKYASHYENLIKAAEAAEAIDRCVEVVGATIDIEQSKPNHPKYRILCRQEDRRTYNEMVDGLSFDTLSTPKEEEKALEKQIMQWKLCRDALNEKTRLMSKLEVLTEERPDPTSFNEEQTHYIIDFNGESMSGAALKYRADCLVSGENVSIEVKRRLEK